MQEARRLGALKYVHPIEGLKKDRCQCRRSYYRRTQKTGVIHRNEKAQMDAPRRG